jgi:hypothetical protein
MLDRDAMVAAVAGCQGVFHVASPVPADKVIDPEASIVIVLSITPSVHERMQLWDP